MVNETIKFNPPKADWGPGPWQDEPDRVDFHHVGFSCMMIRNHSGAWCGYVGIPNDHPLYKVSYHDVDLSAHGGLTYSNKCQSPICHTPTQGYPEDVWWFGFDCSHAWDYTPGLVATMRRLGIKRLTLDKVETYRDMNYVRGEVESLANQLKGYK